MFDLTSALDKWRKSFKGTESIGQTDIKEMETHIIDCIEKLKTQNLSDEEAFLVATHRLGKSDVLETEFQKAHPNRVWQKRFIWMLSGFFMILSLKAIVGLISQLIVFLASFITINFSVLYFVEMGSIGIILFLIGLLAYKLNFSKKETSEKYFPQSIKTIHYIILAVLVSFGQVLPEYLRQWMGNIHHNIYWEVWSKYGGYLSDIHIIGFIANFFFPLLILVFFILLNHSYKKENS